MIRIGNFFFKHRNWIFIFFYAALIIPSWPLFSPARFGNNYHIWPIVIGLFVTCLGQLTRGLTIGLAYIIRGGQGGKPYAEGLVTAGMFRQVRNPLYLGNILMLLGVGILDNSLVYVLIVIPIFILIYHAIVLAEEHFLASKYGEEFAIYSRAVPRWFPTLKELGKTMRSIRFNWKRWILKEYGTQFIWLLGIVLILLLRYPQLTGYNDDRKNLLLITIPLCLGCLYLIARYLKKSGKMKA